MLARLNNILRGLYTAMTARPAATRVGLLDSGELVLVDGFGCAQVLTEYTTDVIRDVLAAGESRTVHLVGEAAGPTGLWTEDPVHSVLREARQ